MAALFLLRLPMDGPPAAEYAALYNIRRVQQFMIHREMDGREKRRHSMRGAQNDAGVAYFGLL